MFEVIKVAGERLVAEVSGFFNKDHIALIAGNAGLLTLEEIVNAFARSVAGTVDKMDFAVKQLIRVLFALATWFGFKKLGNDEMALTASTTISALAGYDVIRYLIKASPEVIGQNVAERLGLARKLASMSMGTIIYKIEAKPFQKQVKIHEKVQGRAGFELPSV